MPDLNFANTSEFTQYLINFHNDNPEYSIPELMDVLYENWATIKWVDIWTVSDNTPTWANEIVNYIDSKSHEEWTWTTLEASDLRVEPDKYSSDMKFIEAANTSNWEDQWYSTQLETLINDYTDTLEEMRNFVHENNSWYWKSKQANKAFADKLSEYREKLKSIEESPELYKLMQWLSEWWTWRLLDEWILNTKTNSILHMIATWEWSKLFANKDRFKNWIDSVQWTWFDNFMTALFSDTDKDAWDIAKYYLKTHKKPEWVEEEWEETDTMKFWKDVEWQKYVNDRNKQLAVMLANKWLVTKEDIDNFLNQYDSWKNANEKDKNVTLMNLSGMAQSNYNKFAKQREEAEKKKKDEERKAAGIWKKMDFSPSNDSPLNWEEDISTREKFNNVIEQAKAKIDNREREFDWSAEAQKWLDMYNKYTQIKAEGWNKWDMKKFFSSNAWVITDNTVKETKDNLKKAWLSNNQINDFVSDWKNTFSGSLTRTVDWKDNRITNSLKNKQNTINLSKWKKK